MFALNRWGTTQSPNWALSMWIRKWNSVSRKIQESDTEVCVLTVLELLKHVTPGCGRLWPHTPNESKVIETLTRKWKMQQCDMVWILCQFTTNPIKREDQPWWCSPLYDLTLAKKVCLPWQMHIVVSESRNEIARCELNFQPVSQVHSHTD